MEAFLDPVAGYGASARPAGQHAGFGSWLTYVAGARTTPDWIAAPDRPLDRDGPVSRAFEPLDDAFVEASAYENLERIARRDPDKLAIADGRISLTYAQLLRAVRALILALDRRVGEGEPVGLLLGNTTLYPAAMIAGMRAGRPIVPLNPKDPVAALRTIAGRAGLKAIVVNGTGVPAGWQNADELAWIDAEACLDEATGSAAALPPLPARDTPAVVLFTSGSTGVPKGIANTERSILHRVQQYVNACHTGADDVITPMTGVATIAGCREMMAALSVGATLSLADIESLGVRAVRQHMQAQGVTVAYLVPALLRLIMKDASPDTFQSLRIVRIGGEKVLWSDIDIVRRLVRPDCFIQISYSSTETQGTHWFLPPGLEESGAALPAGYILPGLEYAVVDDNGKSVEPGGEGELLIRSRHTTLGEWADGRLAAIPADAEKPDCRVFATQDLVRIDQSGLLTVVGRKGRQVKINGRRVEPAELELVLQRSPTIRDLAVVITDAGEIVAFVVPVDATDSDFIGATRELIRSSVPSTVRPTRLHRVAEIPRLRGGKIDASGLRQLDAKLRAEAETVSSPPAGSGDMTVEAVASEVWRTILHMEPAADAIWEESGGDSLKLLQFVLEVETRLDCELSLDAFTVDLSFARIVGAIEAQIGGARARSWPPSALPILFIVPGSIGYGPSLAAFGSRMAEVAHVIAVRLPDLEEMMASDNSIVRMAGVGYNQIVREQPGGDISMLGYSLGGAVAFEVANLLVAAGRKVTFLGILDTNVGPAKRNYAEAIRRTVQRLVAHRVTLDRMMLRAIAKAAVRFGRTGRLAAFIQGMKSPLLARARFILRLELEEVLRMQALGKWLRGTRLPLPVPAVLFRCRRGGAPTSLGWASLVSRLQVVEINGGHLDMLVAPHLEANLPLIRQAFIESRIQAAPPEAP